MCYRLERWMVRPPHLCLLIYRMMFYDMNPLFRTFTATLTSMQLALRSSLALVLPTQSWHSRFLACGKAHSDGKMYKERDKLLCPGRILGLGSKLLQLWVILKAKCNLVRMLSESGPVTARGSFHLRSGMMLHAWPFQSLGNIGLGRDKCIPFRCPVNMF